VAFPRQRLRANGATKARLAVIVLAAVAVALAAVDRSESPNASTQALVRVDFVYSTDLDQLLAPLIERFNEGGFKVRGRSIHIEGRGLTSGEAERLIRTGEEKPVVWAPASSLWGRLLTARVGKPWVPLVTPSIVHSPQVIAIPEPQARKLGWPESTIGWKDIPRLVASGALRFGHPSPLSSTSGLSALAAVYYAVTGKLYGLTNDDVHRARARVRKVERSVVHYAPTANDFLDQLADYGPGYASAVVVQETSLVQFNEQNSWRLVAVYPSDGTFMADYPYIVLNGLWVSEDEADAARAFFEWLRGMITPETAARSGYRDAEESETVLPPVDPEHGADPSQPVFLLRPPAPDVLMAILAAWREDRKLADIVIAVDASMLRKGTAAELRRAVERLLDPLSPRHRVGLVAFGDSVSTAVPLAPLSVNAERLREGLAGLRPTGRTALYDAVADGVRQATSADDSARTTALVVVTDGGDDASSLDLAGLRARIRGSRVRIFTVAYGSKADSRALEAIAATSQGRAFRTSAGELAGVCGDIALYF
jgi:Ca-activated chloride channel homolog